MCESASSILAGGRQVFRAQCVSVQVLATLMNPGVAVERAFLPSRISIVRAHCVCGEARPTPGDAPLAQAGGSRPAGGGSTGSSWCGEADVLMQGSPWRSERIPDKRKQNVRQTS